MFDIADKIEEVGTSPAGSDGEPSAPTTSDYPAPPAISDADEFIWDEDAPIQETYAAFGQRLEATGDSYRRAGYAGGLLLASKNVLVPPTPVTTASQLMCVITDRVRVRVVRNGEVKGRRIALSHLATMLGSEIFLQQFRPIDIVTRTPLYLPDFSQARPGWNDGGRGNRIFYAGPAAQTRPTMEIIKEFLAVMAFATNADRTNAVAFGLTVRLRNFWPGGKPVATVTSSQSQAGKETIVVFAAGGNRVSSISFQAADWALERSFVGALKHQLDTAVIDVDNARLGRGEKFIASGFLERFITDPEPMLFSTGSGGPTSGPNHLMIAITTNYGSLSADLMNRSLPIHLTPTGNIEDRKPAIGNPKLKFLPDNREAIDEEFNGMIERWVDAGQPLDQDVNHPFGPWAQVIGGILKVNGFRDFLGNYGQRKAVDDPLRQALGLLGASHPGTWLPPAQWAEIAVKQGLAKAIIPEADRENEKSRERGIGLVLTGHRDETFHATTDDEVFVLQLEKARRRFDGSKPSTRYRYVAISSEAVPADPEASEEPTASTSAA